MKFQCNSWPCLAIHEKKKKAQLVQKNQPNESTVAKPHLATSSIAMIIVQKNTYVYLCIMYVICIILCIALHKKKNI